MPKVTSVFGLIEESLRTGRWLTLIFWQYAHYLDCSFCGFIVVTASRYSLYGNPPTMERMWDQLRRPI